MTIQIKDMAKYDSFTKNMLVDEIYVLKTRLALCKLDNKTMHARYASEIKRAAANAVKPEPTIKRVVCPGCHGIVVMKTMLVKDVAMGATRRFASCPACQKTFAQKEVNEATEKLAEERNTIITSKSVDMADVSEKLIGRFGIKND